VSGRDRAFLFLRSEAEVEPWLAAWDALAQGAGRPYMSPAWVLAWSRHLRPSLAELRILLVASGDDVLGVGPLCVRRGRLPVTYRVAGMPYDAPKEPLAAPGAIRTVASAIAAALARADPRADVLEITSLPVSSPWREALEGAGAHRVDAAPRSVPAAPLTEPTFDAWMASKSRNFRQQMRRARRRLDDAGGHVRLCGTSDEVAQTLPHLLALHDGRWRDRGGSAVVRPGLAQMLVDATTTLGVPERARVWAIELDGRTISAHLFVGAGDRSTYWLGGFDDAYAALHPGMLCLLAEIEDAFERGRSVVELGAGDHPYKQRLATDDDPVARSTFVFRGPGYVRRRLLSAPLELSAVASARLPSTWKEEIRKRTVRAVHPRPKA